MSFRNLNRRNFCSLAGSAFGTIPLAALLADEGQISNESAPATLKKAKRVVFFYMNGGPSQIDTFDPKPALKKYDGKSYSDPSQIGSKNRVAGTLWKSEFRFAHHGQSGLEISELFPEVSRFADDLCIIRSLQTTSPLHAPAMLRMNTGKNQIGSASLGSWIDYGLGSLNKNLPAFVVMLDPRGGPINGHANWSTGRLPASTPTLIHSTKKPILNLHREQRLSSTDEAEMRELWRTLNERSVESEPTNSLRQARIRNYELAWRMQLAAPAAVDLNQETKATQARYGIEESKTNTFGTQCLLARRLLERGVRFVQIYSGGGEQKNTWDSHVGNVARHKQFAGETDRPIAAFLEDLKQRGLWNETLVIWGGEFGRTPTRESNSNGRDHNPRGFTMWLSGGMVRGGQAIGATDEIGLEAVEKPCKVSDLHATILHLLGLDHEQLKYSENGIETSLTGTEPCQLIQDAMLVREPR